MEANRSAPVATRSGSNAFAWIVMTLLIIGGLNWGLVGLFNFDLVATLFGQMTVLSRIVYVLVGAAALAALALLPKLTRSDI
jgi:uncharacterized protein